MNAVTPALWSFWIALLASAVCAWPIYRMLVALKSRQTVSEYAPEGHQAKQGTPTMGGLIVAVGVMVSLAYLAISDPVPIRPGVNGTVNSSFYLGALTLFVAFAAIGFLDDFVVPRLMEGKRGLGWKQKIVLQLIGAVAGIGVAYGFALTWDNALAVFLVLFVSNAYNFADGLDGLAGSLLIALCFGLAWIGMNTFAGIGAVPLAGALVGGVVPFLFLNAPPARVFMGDVGSLPVGAVLGLVFYSLSRQPEGLTDFQPPSTVPALLMLGLVLVAELVPVPMQIFWVKVFKRKLFPYTPIHHAFEKAGRPESKVVWTFVLVQLLLSVAAATLFVWMHSQQGTPRYHYYFSPELGR